MYLRLNWVGADGLKMLFASVLVALCSGGLSLLFVFLYVTRVARTASAEVPLDNDLCVLVPGVRLENGSVGKDFRQRLERAYVLYQAGARQIILLGGKMAGSMRSEAAAGADYLLMRGLPNTVLRLEEGSRHTLENLRYARELIEQDQALLIVSNRYHLARLAIMADGLGLRSILCAAEASAYWRASRAGRLGLEAFYVHWYLTGRYWARLVGDRKSLERIS